MLCDTVRYKICIVAYLNLARLVRRGSAKEAFYSLEGRGGPLWRFRRALFFSCSLQGVFSLVLFIGSSGGCALSFSSSGLSRSSICFSILFLLLVCNDSCYFFSIRSSVSAIVGSIDWLGERGDDLRDWSSFSRVWVVCLCFGCDGIGCLFETWFVSKTRERE